MEYLFLYLMGCLILYKSKIIPTICEAISNFVKGRKMFSRFYFIGYTIRGRVYTTAHYGPIPELEGAGILNEIDYRGGIVDFQWYGDKEFIRSMIRSYIEDHDN